MQEIKTFQCKPPRVVEENYRLTLPPNGGVQDRVLETDGSGELSWTNRVKRVGAVGSFPNASGATITGSVLNLEPASSHNPGVLTAGEQTIGGDKCFASKLLLASSLGLQATQFFAPKSGGRLTILPNTSLVFLDPVVNIKNFTITLPSRSLIDGQMLWIMTGSKKIEQLKWAGGALAYKPNRIKRGDGLGLAYSAALGKWFVWSSS
ncbi:hypothetical protein HOM50_01340 [bacterium]|nr:hypothetical protein [bacterium]MBT5015034.1 hypothetical protein [bacterium]